MLSRDNHIDGEWREDFICTISFLLFHSLNIIEQWRLLGHSAGLPSVQSFKGTETERGYVGSLAVHQWNFKRQPGTKVALKHLGLQLLLFVTLIKIVSEGLCYVSYLASFFWKKSNHQKVKIV